MGLCANKPYANRASESAQGPDCVLGAQSAAIALQIDCKFQDYKGKAVDVHRGPAHWPAAEQGVKEEEQAAEQAVKEEEHAAKHYHQLAAEQAVKAEEQAHVQAVKAEEQADQQPRRRSMRTRSTTGNKTGNDCKKLKLRTLRP